MAHQLYDNFVLENQFTDILNTKLNTRALMTVDDSLTSEAGTIKKINRYKYTGESEKLAMGVGNTKAGTVTLEPFQYEVALSQQKFSYHDEEVMQDPLVVEVGLKGMATVMVNEFNDDYFVELAKADLEQPYSGKLSYDVIVDAVAQMNLETEEGLFLIINPSHKAEVRKDADFKASRMGEILYNGQIGDINGIPVLVSKKADTPYIATKEAVTCFVKKESEIEQERNADLRRNDVFARRVNLMALTNATKVVKLVKGA